MKTLTLEEALAAHYPFEAQVYEDGSWGFDFPDLDGLSGQPNHGRKLARPHAESVKVHIELMAELGYPIPAPTVQPDYIEVDPDSPLAVILPEDADGEWAYLRTSVVAERLGLSEELGTQTCGKPGARPQMGPRLLLHRIGPRGNEGP